MLGFWDNERKYNVKNYRDKALVMGQCTVHIMVKKLLEIKLGFWDSVRKYNGKKTFRYKAWVLGHERML